MRLRAADAADSTCDSHERGRAAPVGAALRRLSVNAAFRYCLPSSIDAAPANNIVIAEIIASIHRAEQLADGDHHGGSTVGHGIITGQSAAA